MPEQLKLSRENLRKTEFCQNAQKNKGKKMKCGKAKVAHRLYQSYPQSKKAKFKKIGVIHQVIHSIHKKHMCINFVKTKQMFC